MYKEVVMSKFKKDMKLMKKQNKKMSKLKTIVEKLKNGEKLEAKYKDHLLIGDYQGCRECHITPDWLLVYKIVGENLYLVRTGSHTELLESFIKQLLNKLEQLLD